MWRRARQHSRLTGLVGYHLRDPRRRDRRGICNLAARLCAEAKDGQILISSRIAGAVEAIVKLEDLGNLELKGLRRPVSAFNVTEPVSEAPERN